MLRAVTRGKFRQVTTSSGDPVSVKLYRCAVDEPPHDRNGKRYVALDVTEALGDLDLLRKVDAFIDAAAKPDFTPLLGPVVIVKMPLNATYETEDGDPGPAFMLQRGDAVDVELCPGAFGSFGYCWLMRRVKPHVQKKV